MHPLTPYIEGRPHPLGRRLTGVQRCLRTTDLDEVGDDTHLTMFQMLGTWSLGDYPATRACAGVSSCCATGSACRRPAARHRVRGDGRRARHRVATTWQQSRRAGRGTSEDNWWSNGPTGPCGPDSEIFVWTGDGEPTGHADQRRPLGRGVEPRDDALPPPRRRHASTAGAAQRRHRHGPGAAGDGPAGPVLGLRHRRSSSRGCGSSRAVAAGRALAAGRLRPPASRSWSIGDGVHPSNTGRGYVLRRLIRRVLTHPVARRPVPDPVRPAAGVVRAHAEPLPPGRDGHAGPPDPDRRGDPVQQPARPWPEGRSATSGSTSPWTTPTTSTCTRPRAAPGTGGLVAIGGRVPG